MVGPLLFPRVVFRLNCSPGATDPNAPITPAFEACVCPTPGIVSYVACTTNVCNYPSIMNFFESVCAAYGGRESLTHLACDGALMVVGPPATLPTGGGGGSSRRNLQHKPNGLPIVKLQARIPRRAAKVERDILWYSMNGEMHIDEK